MAHFQEIDHYVAKKRQFLSHLHETCSKYLSHEIIILTKLHEDRVKIVDFLLRVIFFSVSLLNIHQFVSYSHWVNRKFLLLFLLLFLLQLLRFQERDVEVSLQWGYFLSRGCSMMSTCNLKIIGIKPFKLMLVGRRACKINWQNYLLSYSWCNVLHDLYGKSSPIIQ